MRKKEEARAKKAAAQSSTNHRTTWTTAHAWLGRVSRDVAILSCSLLLCLDVAVAQAGQLDTTFGTGGIFITHDAQAFDAAAEAIALQTDGRIVVAGEIGSLAGVLRLNINGMLDLTFGTGGMVNVNVPSGLGGGVQVIGVAIQTDGKIVAGISTVNSGGSKAFLLARLEANGALDSSFGGTGLVTTLPFGRQLSPTVLALQPDGKILLAGDGAMARYDTTGQLDATFGTSGIAVLSVRSVTAIALQSNGQILIAGGGPARDSFPPAPIFQTLSIAGLISRYNSNGSIDTTFGAAGQAASVAAASAIAVQSNGKIVVAGSIIAKLAAPPTGSSAGFGLVRYNANGSIDTTFGTRGVAITIFSGAPATEPLALALQSNGDILAGGVAGQMPANASSSAPAPSSFALARYLNTGQLDTTFGSGGRVTTAFGSNTASISALAVQSNGNIVAIGNSDTNVQGSFVNNIAVARYLGQ
jgi:uncharacterized delta-60 repeat protein